MILRKLKEAAEAYLGPHCAESGHHRARRTSTTPSGKRPSTPLPIAGFDTEWELEDPVTKKATKQRMRIINEPTAASLAYAIDKKKNEKIAVFDLGGGTFDISILSIDDEGTFQVKATNGDTHLGGDNFDDVLIEWICDEFKKDNGIDLRKDATALQRIKETAERVKKDLSSQTTADMNLPFITMDAVRAEAHHDVADAGQVRADGGAPDRALQEAGAGCAQRCGPEAEPDRRDRASSAE